MTLMCCPGAPVGLSLGSAYRFRKRWERFFPAVKSVAVVCRVELLNGCEYPWAPGVTQARFLFL